MTDILPCFFARGGFYGLTSPPVRVRAAIHDHPVIRSLKKLVPISHTEGRSRLPSFPPAQLDAHSHVDLAAGRNSYFDLVRSPASGWEGQSAGTRKLGGFMPHVPILLPDKAPKEVNAVYEEFYRKMSFPSPPNFIMTQGHSSTVVRGTWEAVRNILVTGDLPRWQKEMMFVAISKDRDCRYCTAAHIACCRMLGVKPDLIECLIRNVDDLSDPKLHAMIRFALKSSRDPRSVTKEDYESLRQRGLTQSEIMEVVGMSAFAVYANIIADATAMEADQMFDTV